MHPKRNSLRLVTTLFITAFYHAFDCVSKVGSTVLNNLKLCTVRAVNMWLELDIVTGDRI